ncbi:Solute carrier family 25 member 38-like [Hondaea fermentalgiana]|uniref:Solute carrier family 25 member 38-like n=1 Tax=Hondaea fermentalgiana TaxID=2315210 RepID=A0A2R5GNW8_9STRA|nr:Solute carrier family 25 member 38-like [Hondaea fermentalgiana]|eukprot:GBG32580.1 Solute carrier family 25 member 38-like [Hondaea fermentalgiana]
MAAETGGVQQQAMRPRTMLEKQPYMLAYGFAISLFSPLSSLYQLVKLNPKVHMTAPQMTKMAMRILPHQTVLKMAQMDASTPVKENFNPWAAFAVVGVLQGGVYGQANIFFSQALKLGTNPSYAGMFRGFGFAAVRDTISQGAPFVFAEPVRKQFIDPAFPDDEKNPSPLKKSIKHWSSVLGCSIVATVASQGLHNCQITMQSNHDLSHMTAIAKAYKENGVRLLWRGAEARIGLLLIVNILNESLLKKAWEKVPVEDA